MSSVSRAEFARQIRKLDPVEFEEFVADVWSEQGWQTQVTNISNDRGIDVIAQRDTPISEKHLIQAKRYSSDNLVGSPDI